MCCWTLDCYKKFSHIRFSKIIFCLQFFFFLFCFEVDQEKNRRDKKQKKSLTTFFLFLLSFVLKYWYSNIICCTFSFFKIKFGRPTKRRTSKQRTGKWISLLATVSFFFFCSSVSFVLEDADFFSFFLTNSWLQSKNNHYQQHNIFFCAVFFSLLVWVKMLDSEKIQKQVRKN